MVIGVVLAFQLGVSPLLAQLGRSATRATRSPRSPIARARRAHSPRSPLATAILVPRLGRAALGAGPVATRTQEI
jgi:hypothetical protein